MRSTDKSRTSATVRAGWGAAHFALAALAGAALGLAVVGAAHAQTSIGTPAITGDQLLFFYDARPGRVPFLTVSNPSDGTVDVEVAFYPPSLASRVGTQRYTLGPAANVVIDPTSAAVAGGAAAGNAGLAVVTPVANESSTQAIVPPLPLAGSFTLANTDLGTAFGENAFGRLAVSSSGKRAAPKAYVNGFTVMYQRFAPSALTIPTHFDPQSLDAASQDGNRVVLAAFADSYGSEFDVKPATRDAAVTFDDASGQQVASTGVSITGVLLSDLESLAGTSLPASSGKVFFAFGPGSGNVFGVFSQSLGSFASGQRMPALDAVPKGAVSPSTPTPTPAPTPTKTPAPTRTPSGPTPTPTKTPSGPTPTPTRTPSGPTPTPTKTPGGPTPTKTAAPTPTPPPSGGTCNGSATATVTIQRDTSAVPTLAGVTTALHYPAPLGIPGVNGDQSVLDRVTNLTGVSGGIFSAGDQDSNSDGVDDLLQIGLVAIGSNIPNGPFAKIKFDCPAGTSLPASSSIGCDGTGSDPLGLDVSVSCSVTLATP